MIVFAKGWNVNKDGPGQRLIFYLKGCNMNCSWCANPESISRKSQILFYAERIQNSIDYVCPYNAVNGKILDRSKCEECITYDCIEKWKCPSFEFSGRDITLQEILDDALKRRDFFGKCGGVTFGGGEPTVQIDELKEILKLMKIEKINTCVETNASSDRFSELLPLTDCLICDLKAAQEKKHKKYTGISNGRIIQNLFIAAEQHDNFMVRVPLINDFNTDENGINDMMEILSRMNQTRQKRLKKKLRVEVLRMHHIGEAKYKALGMKYQMADKTPPSRELLDTFKCKLSSAGIETINT